MTFMSCNHKLREIRISHLITCERKYINIVNSCNLFLLEFEEIKSCIYRVETANAGKGLCWFWHHLFLILLEGTALLGPRESEITIIDESL